MRLFCERRAEGFRFHVFELTVVGRGESFLFQQLFLLLLLGVHVERAQLRLRLRHRLHKQPRIVPLHPLHPLPPVHLRVVAPPHSQLSSSSFTHPHRQLDPPCLHLSSHPAQLQPSHLQLSSRRVLPPEGHLHQRRPSTRPLGR